MDIKEMMQVLMVEIRENKQQIIRKSKQEMRERM